MPIHAHSNTLPPFLAQHPYPSSMLGQTNTSKSILAVPRRGVMHATVGLVCALAVGGCYERVVSSHGIGTSDATVQPSYRSNTGADRAIDRAFNNKPAPSGRAQRFVQPGSRDPGSKD